MKKLNQNGSQIIVILLVLLLISVLGFGGYYVYSQNKKEDTSASDTSTTSAESQQTQQSGDSEESAEELVTTTVTTLLNEGGSLNVTHPKSWEVVQDQIDMADNVDTTSYKLRKSYVKSPAGFYIRIYELDGIGGACPLGERQDTFTLTHRISTQAPGVVFSQYSYSDAELKSELRLEDHTKYVDPVVTNMKEGETLTDSCLLYIYNNVRLAGDTSLFVSLSKGDPSNPIALSYNDIKDDAEFMAAIQSIK